MLALLALWKKEWLALMRDKHGLLALFVMPAIFILVMSLALKNAFSPGVQLELGYAVMDQDKSQASASFIERLRALNSLRDQGSEATLDQSIASIRNQRHAFVLVIPQGFGKSMQKEGRQLELKEPLKLLADPALPPALEMSFRNQVLATLGTQRVNEFIRRFRNTPYGGVLQEVKIEDWQKQLVTEGVRAKSSTDEDKKKTMPSSVQQSVPAWLIFSMFFVVVPMSAIFINERQQGTLQRLRTQNVSYALILAGKLLPFFLINQIQALVMLLVGYYLVPRFGGDALVLPSGGAQLAALWYMTAAASLAAVSWALCIASLVRTSEQATVIGGVGNILMGAVGGIMVPKFVMPSQMQAMTELSPMAWALDGFHEVMLRGGGVVEIMPYLFSLIGFALLALLAAILISIVSARSHS